MSCLLVAPFASALIACGSSSKYDSNKRRSPSRSSGIAQTFVWGASGNQGVMTVTVPDTTDVTGPNFTGFLAGRKELLSDGGFEDAARDCSLTG